MLLLALELGVAAVVVGAAVVLYAGMRRLGRLRDVPLPPRRAAPLAAGSAGESAPLVSVVVPARNEAPGIEAGLRSLLGQTHHPLEIVVLDDRSDDGTGAIAARVAGDDPRVTVLRINELPAGWLGKNHALWVGAERARGEWLLFTDADVVLEPETIALAVRHAESAGRDHLTLLPRLVMPGAVLQAFVALFAAGFCLWTRPWRAPDPPSRFSVGVGAFNLVRRTTYRAAGTHARLALRPDDDLKLARVLKLAGARAELLRADDLVSVPWYGSIRELISGLEKNSFAGLEYRIARAVGVALAQIAFAAIPFVGVLAGGPARWVGLLAIAVSWLVVAGAARAARVSPAAAFLYPLAAILFAFIVLRTVLVNLVRGGIRWRGTFYPLSLLKSNHV